jgi:putative dimethyl sulfoxide reductase chaperone
MTENAYTKAAAREDLCRFLAACYYEPAVEFTEEHLFDSIVAAADAIDPDLASAARRLREAFNAQDLQTLLVDHTRLFVGPSTPVVMPYASFWLTEDATQRHEATMKVLELYAEGGFDIGDDFRELPDHIAAELEFLYLLVFALNHAASDDERSASAALHRRFINEHLDRWLDGFAAAVAAQAQCPFYRELAALTRNFVRGEATAA